MDDANQVTANASHDDHGWHSPQQQYWHSCFFHSCLPSRNKPWPVPACSRLQLKFPGKSGNFFFEAELILQAQL
jgi:hypothetical protein